MGFFKKDKKNPLIEYTNWEKDFGFLSLMLARKKNITKEFLIGIYSNQKADKDYLTDEEIEPVVQNITNDVLNQIGDSYKNFLIEKYFGSKESLIIYITEDIYVDLISDAVNRNTLKIKSHMYRTIVTDLNSLNKQ